MGGLEGFSVLPRRKALRILLGIGGAATATGGGLLALRGSAPEVAGLRCLGAHEHRTLTALATALFPDDGPFASSNADLPRTFDAFLEGEDEDRRADLKRALSLLEWGPLLFDRRLRTFSNLSADERLAHFERWSTSDSLLRRQVALAFRKFLSVVFYDRPEIWPHIGYVIAPLGGQSP